MVELDSGNIEIDGLNIMDLGLDTVSRSSMVHTLLTNSFDPGYQSSLKKASYLLVVSGK